jgi:uncharacterized protein (DUF362 family)/Pyruvate/2-oxoacid:ferredoxin oxidoreductase delta subunit
MDFTQKTTRKEPVMARLAMIKIDRYDVALIADSLRAASGRLGWDSLFKPGEKILLKPNLLAAVTPDRAVTPHPAVFEAVVEWLQPLALGLSYGDSPAMASPVAAATTAGLAEVASRYNIPLADFSSGRSVPLRAGITLDKAYLAQGILEADGIVNLCKLKTHALTGMTGAVKNLFGAITGPRKAKLHVQYPDVLSFSRMLADLSASLPGRLVVMDAIIAMEGNGPKNGQPRPVGLILAGTDPVAIDAFGAAIMGFAPHELPMLTAAEAAGLGTADLEQIEILTIEPKNGPPQPANLTDLRPALTVLPTVRVSGFVRPHLASSLFTRLTEIGGKPLKRYVLRRPVIDPALCTRCRQCVQACPLEAKALSQPNQATVPVYRYDRCIRCYCCQEICPAGAISVRPAPLGRLAARLARPFRKA